MKNIDAVIKEVFKKFSIVSNKELGFLSMFDIAIDIFKKIDCFESIGKIEALEDCCYFYGEEHTREMLEKITINTINEHIDYDEQESIKKEVIIYMLRKLNSGKTNFQVAAQKVYFTI